MDHYDIHLAHLVAMARIPAFKSYAWHRAQEMAACSSGVWRDIDKRLVAAMKEPRNVSDEPTQGDGG